MCVNLGKLLTLSDLKCKLENVMMFAKFSFRVKHFQYRMMKLWSKMRTMSREGLIEENFQRRHWSSWWTHPSRWRETSQR